MAQGWARTFSGKGIGFMAGFFSGSADSLCLMRFAAEGEEGSSSALRFGAGYFHQLSRFLADVSGAKAYRSHTIFFHLGGHYGRWYRVCDR